MQFKNIDDKLKMALVNWTSPNQYIEICERRHSMKKFLNEFKEFALRGNIMSMAIGVIIGVSFQGLVTSLTDNLISPFIGIFVNYNLDYLYFTIFDATFLYGSFLTSVINFVIIAFVVFTLMRGTNKLFNGVKKAEEPKNPPRLCEFCFTDIHKDATRCPHCTSQLTVLEE